MVEIGASDDRYAGLESWIAAARRGDREALGRALFSFREYLLLVANDAMAPALGAKVGASDIVQDTFFRAHRGFAEFRGRSEAEWRSWLRTILVRSVAHHYRRYELTAKRRRGCEVPIQAGMPAAPESRDPTPSRQLARLERERALMAALDRLPEHYREVVIGHHRERLQFEEIGRRRGITAEAARKLWTRALGRLREELSSDHGSS
jgi:RNA polymerase sigma-70 factor (ECF subfamily)